MVAEANTGGSPSILLKVSPDSSPPRFTSTAAVRTNRTLAVVLRRVDKAGASFSLNCLLNWRRPEPAATLPRILAYLHSVRRGLSGYSRRVTAAYRRDNVPGQSTQVRTSHGPRVVRLSNGSSQHFDTDPHSGKRHSGNIEAVWTGTSSSCPIYHYQLI
jgi:hypothetical protein